MGGKSDTMRQMCWRAVIRSLCWCSLAVAGAASAGAAAAAELRVVATIYPVADMVRQIGKDAVEVSTLLPAGASPHTFEPSPDQIRTLAQAAVFVQIGAGLDSWADKLRAAHSGAMRVVTLTAGLPLLGAAHDHGGSAAGGDPHVWLDPVLVRDHFVPLIATALGEADPAHQALFQQGAAEFQAALTQLDAEIRAALQTVANRNYVSFHAAWRYFGQRYGLHEVAVIEAFPGKEPSAQEVAEAVRQARAAHVRVMLVEPQFSPRMAEQIAHEIGARTALVDPLGGSQLPGRDRYLTLMRYNLQVFAQALQ